MNKLAEQQISKRWWPFVTLCVVSIARAVRSDDHSQMQSTSASLALACAVLCGFSATYVLKTRGSSKRVGHSASKPVIAGALLICGPHVAGLLLPAGASESDLLLAGTLIPVVIALTLSARGATAGLSSKALWCGLAGAAALLLLVPQPALAAPYQVFVLLLVPVLTGIGAVLLYESSKESLWWFPSALGGAFLVFALSSIVHGHSSESFPWLGFAFDLILVACVLLSVSRLGPVRYSAWFVLFPLCLFLYGELLFHLALEIRTIAGFILLLGSSIFLLQADSIEATNDHFRLLK